MLSRKILRQSFMVKTWRQVYVVSSYHDQPWLAMRSLKFLGEQPSHLFLESRHSPDMKAVLKKYPGGCPIFLDDRADFYELSQHLSWGLLFRLCLRHWMGPLPPPAPPSFHPKRSFASSHIMRFRLSQIFKGFPGVATQVWYYLSTRRETEWARLIHQAKGPVVLVCGCSHVKGVIHALKKGLASRDPPLPLGKPAVLKGLLFEFGLLKMLARNF